MAFSGNLSHVFGQDEKFLESSTLLAFVGVAGIAIFLTRSLYRFALPKPFPGIPYNEASIHRLLGDVPDVISHIKQTDGTFITYLKESMIKLNAPLIQVFIRPLSTPLLILADFREAHDLLITRKEFDRSPSLSDLVKGLVPEHHIHLPTEGGWRGQRRLVQDLMGPSFLHNVAGPVIYQRVELMIDLWCSKCRIAEGRPFQANEDINHVSLDAVLAFTYGEDFEHGMTKPNFEAVKSLDSKDIEKLRSCSTDPKTPIQFPEGKLDEVIQATVDLTETVGEIQGKPIPALTRTLVSLRPGVRRATKIKEEYVTKELRGAVKRLHEGGNGEDVVIKSAVDHLVMKERSFAEKEQRKPDYFSRIMIDEIFGFVFAGYETTSTTVSWALKFLADEPSIQTKLRTAMLDAYSDAKAEGRNPNIQEITSKHVPFLNATMEEVLRCSGTAPVVDRQAVVDTEILGHKIPKGTIITCLVTGPSMMSPGFEIDEKVRSQTSQQTIKEGRDRAWDPEDVTLFRPDRWMVNGDFDPTAGPQMAFGLGTRACYGKRLVYVEMKILLVLILWNFELLPCPASLSSYKSVLIMTNEPRQCYVRLRELDHVRKD